MNAGDDDGTEGEATDEAEEEEAGELEEMEEREEREALEWPAVDEAGHPSTGRSESIQGNQHPLLHTLRSVEADDHIEAFDVDSCDMACQRPGQKFSV
ncbi:hypothetical protein FCULG_00002000 [Fusarium culmorum]|uniref:Uncharacterized protein n=1 Tax=Fusarium culmorum TaxID=5516 RepID=A0A2T4GL04_FUSCU|nr:hypothetical protein FCULG_00002000 [Fusarium culmorum]